MDLLSEIGPVGVPLDPVRAVSLPLESFPGGPHRHLEREPNSPLGQRPSYALRVSERLGAARRRVLDDLPDGGRALVVGHSPTNEAAVLGLIGEIVAPLAKGEGVLIAADADGYSVEPLG
jgi:hypothetical protein